jgi:hypothetical protein
MAGADAPPRIALPQIHNVKELRQALRPFPARPTRYSDGLKIALKLLGHNRNGQVLHNFSEMLTKMHA